MVNYKRIFFGGLCIFCYVAHASSFSERLLSTTQSELQKYTIRETSWSRNMLIFPAAEIEILNYRDTEYYPSNALTLRVNIFSNQVVGYMLELFSLDQAEHLRIKSLLLTNAYLYPPTTVGEEDIQTFSYPNRGQPISGTISYNPRLKSVRIDASIDGRLDLIHEQYTLPPDYESETLKGAPIREPGQTQ